MKILVASFLILLFNTRQTSSDVYICVSKTASKYHYSKSCRGLSACTHTISKVTLNDAKNKGYKSLCGWED